VIAGPMEQKGYRLWGKILYGTLSLPVANGVVTAGERIVWVGEAERLPQELKGDDYADVRLPGQTVMPGLVSGHTHFSFGEASLKKQSSSKENATITVAFDRNGSR
jgi:imidazolonepropionase-like amidohydrolase